MLGVKTDTCGQKAVRQAKSFIYTCNHGPTNANQEVGPHPNLMLLLDCLRQWYSTFFVNVPPHIISLQLCTPKDIGA